LKIDQIYHGHGRAINILCHRRVINIFGYERAIIIFVYWTAINILGYGSFLLGGNLDLWEI
jgi:hypothetical protein